MTASTNKTVTPCMEAVESVLDRCEHYTNYMRAIDPVTPHDIWRRYLFAYSTVNMSWQSSVTLYNELNLLQWPGAEEEDIKQAFLRARSGFHNTRPRYIADFARKYWTGTDFLKFQHRPGQRWKELRNTLSKQILGLGQIKISFAMELIYPLETEIVCLDRHMLGRVFNTDPTRTVLKGQYLHCEMLWVHTCNSYGVAPGIARLAYWDKMQNMTSPDYWAHVLKRAVD